MGNYAEKERYSVRCAVFLILTKVEDEKVYTLLQKRFHTGLLDGQYDVACSGHLEKEETLKEAMIRETKEEIGIEVTKENLNYISTIHAKFRDAEYLLVTFQTSIYEGTPKIMEPNKCNELKWFPITKLPEEIIDTRKMMIEDYLNSTTYHEYGFKN